MNHKPSGTMINMWGFVEEPRVMRLWEKRTPSEAEWKALVTPTVDWTQFRPYVNLGPRFTERRATLYMHGCVLDDRTERLVVVELDDYSDFLFVVIEPATLSREARVLRSGKVDCDPLSHEFLNRAMTFDPPPFLQEGVQDPVVSTQFSLRFTFRGIPETLRGQLNPNNTVSICLVDLAGARKRQFDTGAIFP